MCEGTPESLAYRAGFAQLITAISRDFISMPPDQIDRGIQAALRAVGEYAVVDHAFLFQFSENLSLLVNIDEWCADPVASHLEKFRGLATRSLPWAHARIVSRKVISVPRLSELPPGARAERDVWEDVGSKSLLILPVEAAGKLLGALGLETVRAEREWSDDLIASLRTVSEVLANALDRKRREEALRESEERFRTLVENAHDLITDIASDGQMLLASPNHREVIGWESSELVGTRFSEYLHPDDRESVESRVEQAFSSGVATDTFRVRHKNGTYRWFECTGRRYKTRRNEIRIVSISRDVTERKQMEEERDRILTLSQDLICIAGMDGFFRYLNPAWENALGYTSEELLSRPFLDFTHPDDHAKNAEEVARLSTGQPTPDFENRYIHKDGSIRHIAWRATPIPEERTMYCIGRDVTERKRAEEEKLALQRQVQHAQKLESLGVLAGGIAHDFNNILMAILGNADMALQELSPHAPARNSIKEIEKASRRAAGLAKQMLAYSGKGRFVVEAIDLNELVSEMAHLLEVSISKKATLKYDLAVDLPTFNGDDTQVRQVIMNLITNASEALGDEGGVIALSTGADYCERAYLDAVDTIPHIGVEEPLPEGSYVYLQVSDTGCGMHPDTVAKIFDPFFTTKFTGRGLGMSVVLGIVRGHRGAIQVDSEVERGSTFRVLFPALDEPAELLTTEPTDEKEWRGGGTILLVDDEEVVVRVVRRMLEGMGFQVLCANNGREALEAFCAHADEFVCVLLDLTMPDLDGEQVFCEIRRLRPDAKVILSSGYDKSDVTQRFAREGLAGFIQKPYGSTRLRAKLREVLGH